MSLKKSLSKVLLFLVLEVGTLLGVPMGPRQVEELMQILNRTHHEHVLKSEKDDGLNP
jgi:hypothetical protein